MDWSDTATLAVAIIAALVAAVSPFVSWRLTRRGQLDDARRQTKISVFGGVMQNRHNPESHESVAALNLIDVAFHDAPSVRRHWREYYEMVSSSAYFENDLGIRMRQQKLEDLLTDMAVNLDFGVDRFDVARIYVPRWLIDDSRLRLLERQSRLNNFEKARLTASAREQTGETTSSVEGHPPAGSYLMKAKSSAGSASVILIIGNGSIAGIDVGGTKFSGSYRVEEQRFTGFITLQVPAGEPLITGHKFDEYREIRIDLDFPLDFYQGPPQSITLLGEQVQVTFSLIQ